MSLTATAIEVGAGEKDGASDWPEDVFRDHRIISSWADGHIVVRLPNGDRRRIEIANVPLPGNGDVAGPFNKAARVGDFPHWTDTCRAYFSMALSETTSHDSVSVANNALNHVFRLLAWCVRRRIYRLHALTVADFEALKRALVPNGWYSALETETALQHISTLASEQPELRTSLIHESGSVVSIRANFLSSAIGYVLTSREFPPWFTQAMHGLSRRKSRHRTGCRKDPIGWSQSSFKNCFVALRRLSRLPTGVDGLAFDPFPNTRLAAKEAGGRPDGRTPNLPIEAAGQLLTTSLRWLGRRADGVEKLLGIWTAALTDPENASEDLQTRRAWAASAMRNAYPAIQKEFDLPAGPCLKGTNSLADLMKNIHTSAAIVIGINQARRKNEILGEGSRPWGLYPGCVRRVDPFLQAYEIDIYIEKTWRDWRQMSANRLVADAVAVLERLRAAMPGPLTVPDGDATILRGQKLFVFPSDSTEGLYKLAQYKFEEHSRRLFAEAGVDSKYRRTHLFRRLFALLYMYRFDHPRLQALSEFLVHLDLESTQIYVTDPDLQKEAERIEAMYRRSDAPVEELEAARDEYFDYQVEMMLSSPETGGTLTRRVRKWASRLAQHVDFQDDELDALQQGVRGRMERLGYAPQPFPHGICWADGRRHSNRAGCESAGTLRRELAGVRTCSSCPFHSTSVSFLESVRSDIKALESRLCDATCDDEARVLELEIAALNGLVSTELTLMSRSAATVGRADAKVVHE